MKEKCEKIWDIPYELMSGREQNKRVYSTNGLCPTLYCFGGGNTETKIMMKTICLNSKVNGKQPSLNDRVYSRGGLSMAITTTRFFMGNVLEGENMKLRIRKLTEGECMRLMGFEEKDTEACRKEGLSKANIYHQSGDSICVTVLVAIFGELLNNDHIKAIEEYTNGLHKEVENDSV